MILTYESWKKIVSNPLFDFISIGLGLAFTIFFAFFNPEIAVRVSICIFFSVALFSLLLAFIWRDKQDVIAVAQRIDKKGKHSDALNILIKARGKVRNEEDRLKIDYELGVVYCSLKQYRQAISILSAILKSENTKWTWKVYLQLAKALSYTTGYCSNETLDAYLKCIQYKKKFDEYGKDDLKTDIDLCHKINKIYTIKEDVVPSNKWFREEMLLRDASCDIGIKNKICDLTNSAAALVKKNRTEDALRQYEEAAYLIEKYISEDCDRYAVVQLEMGTLFWKGYVLPRYDFALECFQKAVKIKRRYMADLTKELTNSFSNNRPVLQELCIMSIDDIQQAYYKFANMRNSCNMYDLTELQNLVNLREKVADKCYNILPLFEEAFPSNSLELAKIYHFLGLVYKWCPLNIDGIKLATKYLKKTAEIWNQHKNNKSIQTQLAHLLVDLGGTYVMGNDYETALSYRLDALKTIMSEDNPDIEDVGQIELALKGVYQKTAQSKIIEYNRFLEDNGLSTVIERLQVQPLGNGWVNCKVKLRGLEKECNWKLSGFGNSEESEQ